MNLVNLITLMTEPATTGEDGVEHQARFAPDFADEIVDGCCVTDRGRIHHQPTREAIEGPDPEPAAEPEPVAAADPDPTVAMPVEDQEGQS